MINRLAGMSNSTSAGGIGQGGEREDVESIYRYWRNTKRCIQDSGAGGGNAAKGIDDEIRGSGDSV